MSVLKSKKFTIDGLSGSYVLAMDELFRVQGVYKDGKIMNPASDEWTTAVLSDESRVIRATYKGVAGESMSLVEDDISAKFYDNESKKETNVEQQQSLLENPIPTTFAAPLYAAPLYGKSPTFSSFTGRKYTRTTTDTFAYPIDIDKGQDYIKITKFKYKRSSVNQSGPDGSVAGDKVGGDYAGTVLLPMPKVSDSNGAEWGESDLNVMGVALASIYGGLANAGKLKMQDLMKDAFSRKVGPFANLDSQLTQRITENISGTGKIIGSQLASSAIKVAGITVSPDALLARATGSIANPNAELLFQGPVLRDFGFSFLMIARSQAEGKQIRKIIKWFKEGAAPKYENVALLGSPDVFKLEYSAPILNSFNEMALRTITVDYAPDGYWAAYDDSHPIACVMNLQFTELRPVYDKDHEKTAENSVGF